MLPDRQEAYERSIELLNEKLGAARTKVKGFLREIYDLNRGANARITRSSFGARVRNAESALQHVEDAGDAFQAELDGWRVV